MNHGHFLSRNRFNPSDVYKNTILKKSVMIGHNPFIKGDASSKNIKIR